MSQLQTLVFGDQWIFSVVVAAILLGISEVGYRIGLRLFSVHDEARRSQIGGVQGAVLGLLGLLLGFTFSMAVNRFEARRELVLTEANAIGTTWLRADLLPETHRPAVKELLRRFVDVRVEYQRTSEDPVRLGSARKSGTPRIESRNGSSRTTSCCPRSPSGSSPMASTSSI